MPDARQNEFAPMMLAAFEDIAGRVMEMSKSVPAVLPALWAARAGAFHASVMFIRHTRHGDLNEAAAALIGSTPEQLLGRVVVGDEVDIPAFLRALDRLSPRDPFSQDSYLALAALCRKGGAVADIVDTLDEVRAYTLEQLAALDAHAWNLPANARAIMAEDMPPSHIADVASAVAFIRAQGLSDVGFEQRLGAARSRQALSSVVLEALDGLRLPGIGVDMPPASRILTSFGQLRAAFRRFNLGHAAQAAACSALMGTAAWAIFDSDRATALVRLDLLGPQEAGHPVLAIGDVHIEGGDGSLAADIRLRIEHELRAVAGLTLVAAGLPRILAGFDLLAEDAPAPLHHARDAIQTRSAPRPPSPSPMAVAAWGTFSPRMAAIVHAEPAILATLARAPAALFHCITLWVRQHPEIEASQAAEIIQRTSPRDLLAGLVGDGADVMFKALARLNREAAHSGDAYARLLRLCKGPVAPLLSSANRLNDRRLATLAMLVMRAESGLPEMLSMGPALVDARPSRVVEIADALVLLKTMGLFDPGDRAGQMAWRQARTSDHFLRLIARTLDRASLPGLGIEIPAESDLRSIDTLGDLRDCGLRYRNCLRWADDLAQDALAGKRVFLEFKPSPVLIALDILTRRPGCAVATIGQIRGVDNEPPDPGIVNAVLTAIREIPGLRTTRFGLDRIIPLAFRAAQGMPTDPDPVSEAEEEREGYDPMEDLYEDFL